MSEWTVVTVLVALAGLFLTVGKPVISLNSSIVKLNLSIDALQRQVDGQAGDLKETRESAKESHRRLWEHNGQQDEKLTDHERRIQGLEGR